MSSEATSGGGRDGRNAFERLLDDLRRRLDESAASLPPEVRNPPLPHETIAPILRATEAFWANDLRRGLSGNYDQPYDPNLTYQGAYEELGLPRPAAQGLGLASGLLEPGPGEALDVARVAGPALASVLPRELLDRLAGTTRVLDEAGRPARQLHGTGTAFDVPDLDKANPTTLFGRGFYTTEGYYPSRTAPPPLDPWTGQPVPHDTVLEQTTDRYARQARSLNPNAAPQVHLSYLDARNPFDYSQVAPDPEALGREIIAGTGLRGNARRNAEQQFASILEDIPNHPLFGEHGHPGQITAGDVMSAVQSAVTGYGGGYMPDAAKGVYGMGHDAIVARTNAAGSPTFSGPRAWHVRSGEQVIPAGNIPLAVAQMLRRGLLEPDESLVRALGQQYGPPPHLVAREAPTAPVRAQAAKVRPPDWIDDDNLEGVLETVASDPHLRTRYREAADLMDTSDVALTDYIVDDLRNALGDRFQGEFDDFRFDLADMMDTIVDLKEPKYDLFHRVFEMQ